MILLCSKRTLQVQLHCSLGCFKCNSVLRQWCIYGTHANYGPIRITTCCNFGRCNVNWPHHKVERYCYLKHKRIAADVHCCTTACTSDFTSRCTPVLMHSPRCTSVVIHSPLFFRGSNLRPMHVSRTKPPLDQVHVPKATPQCKHMNRRLGLPHAVNMSMLLQRFGYLYAIVGALWNIHLDMFSDCSFVVHQLCILGNMRYNQCAIDVMPTNLGCASILRHTQICCATRFPMRECIMCVRLCIGNVSGSQARARCAFCASLTTQALEQRRYKICTSSRHGCTTLLHGRQCQEKLMCISILGCATVLLGRQSGS